MRMKEEEAEKEGVDEERENERWKSGRKEERRGENEESK
jgi:hypothetical protein